MVDRCCLMRLYIGRRESRSIRAAEGHGEDRQGLIDLVRAIKGVLIACAVLGPVFGSFQLLRLHLLPANALSTSTYKQDYNDITVVYVYVDAEEVRAADIVTTTSRPQPGVYTDYMQPVVYTAPSSCPTPFTVSTYTRVNLPDAVTQLYT